MQPYAVVEAELWLDLTSFSSPSEFPEIAETAFKKTVVALVPALSKTSQVTAINVTKTPASSSSSNRRLGSIGRQSNSDSGSIRVRFTIAVDVREASVASGKVYTILGPSSDDAWASSNTSIAEATGLVEDMVADLLAAIIDDSEQRRLVAASSSSQGESSAASALAAHTLYSNSRRTEASQSWDEVATSIVDAMPVAATGGDLSLVAAPRSVAYDPGSIEVTICRFNDPCIAPTPGPTMARPSQVLKI